MVCLFALCCDTVERGDESRAECIKRLECWDQGEPFLGTAYRGFPPPTHTLCWEAKGLSGLRSRQFIPPVHTGDHVVLIKMTINNSGQELFANSVHLLVAIIVIYFLPMGYLDVIHCGVVDSIL